jgi:hypothetical protein
MLALNRLDRRDQVDLIEQIARGKALPDESSPRSPIAPTACHCLSRN